MQRPPLEGTCGLCERPATLVCSNCKSIFYCNGKHQKGHWKVHKLKCRPYKVIRNEILGRYLVATRDIDPGEIIMCEKPLVLGPKVIAPPTCLGCYQLVQPDPITNKFYHCHSCGWPLCNPNCAEDPDHVAECIVMRRTLGYSAEIEFEHPAKKEPAYSYIAPLRALLLAQTCPRKFHALLGLESHHEDRQDSPLYHVYRQLVVPFIKRIGLNTDEDTILRINGIFDTNAFEIRKGGVKIRGIYPNAAMLSHDCRPNTRHAFFGPVFELILFATVPIRMGEPITATYTQSLWGTLARRKHLRTVKFFECQCSRCGDSTEFGMYVGSIYCADCKQRVYGNKKPKESLRVSKMISSDPLNAGAIWKCETCAKLLPAEEIQKINDQARDALTKLDKSTPHNLEQFLRNHEHVFPPTSSICLDIKYALVQLYGSSRAPPEYALDKLNDRMLARKIFLCQELLNAADALEPGLTLFRGNLLFELHAAIFLETKIQYGKNSISKQRAKAKLEECMIVLQDGANILKKEPGMRHQIETALKELTLEIFLLDRSGDKKSAKPAQT